MYIGATRMLSSLSHFASHIDTTICASDLLAYAIAVALRKITDYDFDTGKTTEAGKEDGEKGKNRHSIQLHLLWFISVRGSVHLCNSKHAYLGVSLNEHHGAPCQVNKNKTAL